MNDLQKNIERYCQDQALIATHDKIVVGVSGGPDSVCLLALLLALTSVYKLHLHVAHLNHQLRGQAADDDARYVAGLAHCWGVPATISEENVAVFSRRNKLSLEDAARRLRYTFLRQVAADVGATKVAVAHNANDQAETVLMHFLRGAGVTGLRGMRPLMAMADFGAGDSETPHRLGSVQAGPALIRPLLDTPRADIEQYCQAHNLSPRFDASNQDLTFQRNRVRHELLPLLETYNPNITQTLAQTATLMTADYEVLSWELDQAWQATLKSQTAEAITLNLSHWRTLPLGLQRGIVRRAIYHFRGRLDNITFSHIEQVIKLLQTAQTGSHLDLPHALCLTIDYDQVILAAQGYQTPRPDWPYLPPGGTLKLNVPGSTWLSDGQWVAQTVLLQVEDLSDFALQQINPWQSYLDADKLGPDLILRGRRPGDIFYPLGLKGHHQRLKDFMINQKISAAYREQIPLLISTRGDIAWVCGWRIDHHHRVTEDTKRILQVQFEKGV